MYLFWQILAALAAACTYWGLIPSDRWWVRAADFPRIQILVCGLAAWLALLFYLPDWQALQWAVFLLLTGAMAFQLRMVLPYTAVWRKEVKQAKGRPGALRLKILVSNVLTPNDNTDALVNLVQQYRPDLVLTLETDKKWERALEVIEPDYPHSVKIPLDNLYGMHLYSRLPLIDAQTHYRIVDDIPSITAKLKMPDGETVWLYCLHPMPPSPTEAEKSTTRDAELLLVGRAIRENRQNAIVTGDLNDVAWSKTTRIFRRVSGLLDPRIGRKFINTFHAKMPLMRWALDHLFHSPCFTLVSMQRMPGIGSDHFPVLTELQYEPADGDLAALQEAESPTASAEDRLQTREKIQEGIEEGERMSAERAKEVQEQEQATLTSRPFSI